MSTYKEQDAENLLAHLREGIDPDSVSALLDDTRVDCEGTGEGESVWMHLVFPGARYGKDDRVIYDPYETFSGRSLKSSGGLPMVEFSTCIAATTAPMRRATSRTWSPCRISSAATT